MRPDATTLHGSCHCRKLRIEFATQRAPRETIPRACDCSFCQKHGAAYVSDPAGQLRLTVRDHALHVYRQGSETARFLLCALCGVLVAVTFEHEGRAFGAVNATCLDEHSSFAPAVCASPQRLSAEAKVARWLELWVPDVEVVTFGN